MSKALGLLSGGLDSTLAAELLRRQGIDVTCVAFVTPFFGASRAQKAATALGIPLIIQEISDIHLEVVKHPRYGYGRNLNPCIDCHALMFRLAGALMAERGFDFLFSGEVLGQRPMSQNLTALQAVAKHSDYGSRILRPLSAQLLPITPMEETGLVDREQLLDIKGRTRRRQEALAKEWGIVDYPASGGGCLLTEKSFVGRLRDLLLYAPDCTAHDVELLKIGRQFRLSPQAKLALGRSQEDNEKIQNSARPDDFILRCADFSGPLGLVSGSPSSADLELAAALLATYGKGKDAPLVKILFWQAGEVQPALTVTPLARDQLSLHQID